MLKIIGIVLLLLTGLGAIYFHLFVWSTRRPGQGWPWRACASFGGPALAGIGLILGHWSLVAVGVASWLLARLTRDGSLEHLDR